MREVKDDSIKDIFMVLSLAVLFGFPDFFSELGSIEVKFSR